MSESEEYIIGCNKWVKGEKWRRYTKVPEDIDLEYLFQGRNIYIYIMLLILN